jgi:hypothetical protein
MLICSLKRFPYQEARGKTLRVPRAPPLSHPLSWHCGVHGSFGNSVFVVIAVPMRSLGCPAVSGVPCVSTSDPGHSSFSTAVRKPLPPK